MKTNILFEQALVHHYDNPKADRYLQQSITECTEQTTHLAIRDGEENLPPLQGSDPSIYWQPIRSALELKEDELKRIHLSDESTIAQQNLLKKEVHQLRIQKDQASADYEKSNGLLLKLFPQSPSMGAVLVSIIIIALAITESLMMLSAIRLYIPNILAAAGVCLLFSAGWVILAHKFHIWFNSGQGWKRLIRRAILITGFSMVFLCIAILRSYYIHLSNLPLEFAGSMAVWDVAQWDESIIYMGLSWLFFLPATLIAHYSVRLSSLTALTQVMKRRKDLKKIQQQIEVLNQSIQRINSEIDLLTLLDQSKEMRLKRDEQTFDKLRNHLTHLYISTNLKVRPDRQIPECFLQYLHQPGK
ncbi:MAG: hypothetical protein GC181_10730 [Bacteroidetes bacterium]|nr:hypothetical protein [Bacteroidota bacterium]